MATVFCTGCQKNYGVPPAMAGRTVRCKACGGTLVIPAEPAPVPVVPVPVEPVPVQPVAVVPVSAGSDLPLPVAAIPVGFDFGTIPVTDPGAYPPPLPPRKAAAAWPTPAPPPPYRPFQPPPAGFSLGFDFKVWKIVPVLVAGAFLAFGITQWIIAGSSTAVPQPITCQALETTGAGKNHHIRLTDFSALRVYFIGEKGQPSQYELVALVPPSEVRKSGTNRAHAKVADEGSVSGSAIHVFLKTKELKQNTDFLGVVNRPYIDGMVGDPFDSVPSEASSILSDHYPGLNTSNSIILEEGKTPPKTGLAVSILAAGALLLLLALGLFFVKYE